MHDSEQHSVGPSAKFPWPPRLLAEQSAPERIFAIFIGPILLGAICGWLLGVSEIGYTVLTVLAIAGGIAAGYEHSSVRSGALRGVWGGTLFALTIGEVHRLIGAEAAATVPDPVELLVVVFAIAGSAFGAIGAALRRKHQRAREDSNL